MPAASRAPITDPISTWRQHGSRESQGLTAQQAGPWWQGFQDPALDRLVEAVLAANPDMRVAGLKTQNALLGADLADTNLTLGQRQSRGQRHPRT